VSGMDPAFSAILPTEDNSPPLSGNVWSNHGVVVLWWR
jgi:hypothetical protein